MLGWLGWMSAICAWVDAAGWWLAWLAGGRGLSVGYAGGVSGYGLAVPCGLSCGSVI